MLLYFIRALFIVVIAALLFVSIFITPTSDAPEITAVYIRVIAGLGVAILVIAIDWLTPKKSLNALAGVGYSDLQEFVRSSCGFYVYSSLVCYGVDRV